MSDGIRRKVEDLKGRPVKARRATPKEELLGAPTIYDR